MRLHSPLSEPPVAGDRPTCGNSLYDPQAQWLRTLYHGLVAATVGTLLSALWSFLQFSSRVHGVPDRQTLDSLFGFLTLGSMMINWAGAWLLTTQPPYPPISNVSILRCRMLRALFTALFALWSLRLFGLLGVAPRPGYRELGFWFTVQATEAAAIMLFWLHMWSIAVSVGLDRLRSRAIAILVGRGATVTALGVGPTAWSLLTGANTRLGWDFFNWRSLLYVLWSALAALVLMRFAAAVRKVEISTFD